MGVSKFLAVFLVLTIAASAHGETYFNKPVPPSEPLIPSSSIKSLYFNTYEGPATALPSYTGR